jgi:hypothetical protein
VAEVTEHPPGTIIIPCGDQGRWSVFTFALNDLSRPPDTATWGVRTMDVSAGLNAGIRELVGEWAWIMGDDHVFAPDTLMKLLDLDVDVVVPLCAKRNPPFDLVLFSEEGSVMQDGREYPQYTFLSWEDVPEEGLFEVHAAGSAGMLVRKHVLDTVGDPWFESSSGAMINDDLEFCRKIREAGFIIHATADVWIGHISGYTVTPQLRDGTWGVHLDLRGGSGEDNGIWLGDPRALARSPGAEMGAPA